MLGPENIVLVYHRRPRGDDAAAEHRLVGRLLVSDDGIDVLEDHDGSLQDLDGAEPEVALRRLANLANSQYFTVATLDDIQKGHRLDLIPDLPHEDAPEDLGSAVQGSSGWEAPRPEPVFEYCFQGHRPQVVEARDGQVFLDGSALEPEEHEHLLANVRNGLATLRYARAEEPVQKSEDLAKLEPRLAQALNGIRAAVRAGHLPPEHLKTLASEIFRDHMVPTVGNRKAYLDFLGRPRTGVHVRIDGNSLGIVNKVQGFEAGDAAIRALFGAARQAMDETVGRKAGKLFRIGGDEAHAFVPTHEDAARFARAFRGKMQAVPPVGGTHQLSASIGIGHSPETAEQALIQAKGAKRASGLPAGREATHAHSLVPGSEGPVPVEPELAPQIRSLPIVGSPTT